MPLHYDGALIFKMGSKAADQILIGIPHFPHTFFEKKGMSHTFCCEKCGDMKRISR